VYDQARVHNNSFIIFKVAVKSVRIPQSDDTQLVEKAGQVSARSNYKSSPSQVRSLNRGFVVKLMFGSAWSTTIFSNSMASSRALGYSRR